MVPNIPQKNHRIILGGSDLWRLSSPNCCSKQDQFIAGYSGLGSVKLTISQKMEILQPLSYLSVFDHPHEKPHI